jgi:hypothetical protein
MEKPKYILSEQNSEHCKILCTIDSIINYYYNSNYDKFDFLIINNILNQSFDPTFENCINEANNVVKRAFEHVEKIDKLVSKIKSKNTIKLNNEFKNSTSKYNFDCLEVFTTATETAYDTICSLAKHYASLAKDAVDNSFKCLNDKDAVYNVVIALYNGFLCLKISLDTDS